MPKPQGRCIYCGGAGLSKEHFWGDWLKAYIPREREWHKTQEQIAFPDSSGDIVKQTERQGDPYGRKLRVVCETCNIGWMSKLQERAKSILVPMLVGESISMYRNGQTAVAAWATMFIMTAEFMSPDKVSVAPIERTWFKNNQKPPSHWRIWLGRREPEKVSHLLWRHVLTFVEQESEALPPGTIPVSNSQTSTILLGQHLVIHVISSPIARRIVKRWRHPIDLAPRLTQIWPIKNRQVMWPPATGLLSLDDVHRLASHFWNRVDAVAKKNAGLV